MNEAETRAEHIDPALKAAGWGVVEGSRVRREVPITPGRIEGLGRRGKGLTADYVLEYRNTKLAVIEAKAWNQALTEGVAQAKNYAGKLAVRFTYATNGQGIYAIDMHTGTEAEAASYPTPDELWARTFAQEDAWRDRFAAVPYEDKGGSHPGRYYQDIAIERVLQAIAAKRDRILLTLATDTGKTFIAFQIAWKLFYSRWNLSRETTRRPRILFLADRNILANQAYNAFSAFPEDALVRADHVVRAAGEIRAPGVEIFLRADRSARIRRDLPVDAPSPVHRIPGARRGVLRGNGARRATRGNDACAGGGDSDCAVVRVMVRALPDAGQGHQPPGGQGGDDVGSGGRVRIPGRRPVCRTRCRGHWQRGVEDVAQDLRRGHAQQGLAGRCAARPGVRQVASHVDLSSSHRGAVPQQR